MKWEAISTHDGFAFVLFDNDSVVGLCCVKSDRGTSFYRRSKHLKELDNESFLSIGDARLSVLDHWVNAPRNKHVLVCSELDFQLLDPDMLLHQMVSVEKLAKMWNPDAEQTEAVIVFEIIKMIDAFFESFDSLTKKRAQVLEKIMET